jgi:transcriptional regulator with XRE-family HTH domain
VRTKSKALLISEAAIMLTVMSVGKLIRQARNDAHLSGAAVAKAMGLSTPYLHDIEHDRRRLVSTRWPSLLAAIPGLDARALCEKSVDAGNVEIDPSLLAPAQREILIGLLLVALDRGTPKRARKGARP